MTIPTYGTRRSIIELNTVEKNNIDVGCHDGGDGDEGVAGWPQTDCLCDAEVNNGDGGSVLSLRVNRNSNRVSQTKRLFDAHGSSRNQHIDYRIYICMTMVEIVYVRVLTVSRHCCLD